MKKLMILFTALLIVSCGNDECQEQAQIQYIGQPSMIDGKAVQNDIITEDTCFDGDKTWQGTLRINNGVTVTVNGDARINGSNLLMLGSARLNVTGDITFVNTIFFVNSGGGVIDCDGSIFVSNDSNANSGASGTIYYCTTMTNQVVTGSVTITQDCEKVEDCETLSDNGLNTSLGAIVGVPCGYDFVNQKVKTDDNGNSYIYLKLD